MFISSVDVDDTTVVFEVCRVRNVNAVIWLHLVNFSLSLAFVVIY